MFIQGIYLARESGFVYRYNNGLGSDSLFATIFQRRIMFIQIIETKLRKKTNGFCSSLCHLSVFGYPR